jgi:hypothetical protein
VQISRAFFRIKNRIFCSIITIRYDNQSDVFGFSEAAIAMKVKYVKGADSWLKDTGRQVYDIGCRKTKLTDAAGGFQHGKINLLFMQITAWRQTGKSSSHVKGREPGN